MMAVEMADALEVHPNTIYTDLHAFAQHGVQAIDQLGSPGAPVRLSEAQRAEMWRLAEVPPSECGWPYGRWSVAQLRSSLLTPGVVKAISREPLRRVLKKGGATSGGSAASSSAGILAGRPS
jgi:transposase